MTLVDQPAVEIDTDDEAMLEALTLAGEEVIRAIADMQTIHDRLQSSWRGGLWKW